MTHLLSRARGKTFYLLILSSLFLSGCNSSDDDDTVMPGPVGNSAPAITSVDTDTASSGIPYTYALTATDADGDAVTFQASLLPSWLTFNAATGELTGTATRAQAGDYNVTLAASDGMASTPLFLTITVAIVNEAPAITSTAINNAVVGSAYSYTLTTTDIDADTIVTSLVSTLPAWASFDASTSTVSGTPDALGDVEIELSASDSALSSSQKYTLVVTSVPALVLGFDETVAFGDFAGAATDIIANPDASGINTSVNVGRMQKFAGEVFAGTTIALDNPLTLNANNMFSFKVWSQRQVALTFKLEGDTDANDVERVVTHDGTGWEEMSFDFTDVTGSGYTGITLIFENGVMGAAATDAVNWTFYLDDLVAPFIAVDDGATSAPEIAVNGGFENAYTGWNEIGAIVMEGTNSVFQADVTAAGNPWDVNLSQVVTLVQDSDYTLTFKAKASVARSIVSGIGQNYDPFLNVTETVALTTDWVTYTLNLKATGFGDANNRIIFDMGAEIGMVSIDDVSLKLASSDGGDTGGGDTSGTITTNGDFEVGDLSGWTSTPNGGSIVADNTQDSGSTWVAKIDAIPSVGVALSQDGMAVGSVSPGDTIDISFDMCGSVADGGEVFVGLLSEPGGDAGSVRQNVVANFAPPAVWTRYNYSTAAGSNVAGGVSLQFDVVCGGAATCKAQAFIDNVSVTIGGGAVAGDAGGASCVAADTGGDDSTTTPGDAIGFEGTINAGDFNNFGGGVSTVVANPFATGINTSAQVVKMVKSADEVYGGSTYTLPSAVNIASGSVMKMKVYATRAVKVLFKLEGGPVAEITANHTGSGWEELSFDFGNTNGDGNTGVTVIFDNGTQGDAANNAADWTFYYDDIVFPAAVDDGGTTPVADLAVELVVFETNELPQWSAWVDGGGSSGTDELIQDGDKGGVIKFSLTAPTVAGFTSRDIHEAVNGMTFDASSLNNGMITFDFKMVTAPTAGLVDWKFKVESSGGQAAEVNLSSSVESHATPVLDTWQTYSFPIATLVAAGLDATKIDLFMVFPDYNSAAGAQYHMDNFKITSGGAVPADPGSASMSGGDLVVDIANGINFEGTLAQQSSWNVFENVTNPALEFVPNPSAVGNTSAQVAKITLEGAAAGSGKFAGSSTRTVTPFKLTNSNVIAKIWVYKDKISPVGIKLERKNSDGYGSQGELTVSNTKVNEWEQLTIDFSDQLGKVESDAISGIVIFPDMVDGRAATVAYFDEITFTAN